MDHIGENLGLSEIEVFSSPTDYADHVSWVDPYIETTQGRYFYCVTGSQPFGMISASPMTRNQNQIGGGYNYNSTHIPGFPQLHNWVLSGLTLMPTKIRSANRKRLSGTKIPISRHMRLRPLPEPKTHTTQVKKALTTANPNCRSSMKSSLLHSF